MKKKLLITALVLAALLICAVPALADETTVTFDCTYEYSLARAAFTLTNEFRTGDQAWYWNSDNETVTDLSGTLSPLTYDYGLERAAMERAAEIAVFFSHTRPDGRSCFTVHGNSYGENIAAGYGSAESVVKGWREDNDDYSGQGHRRNMLGKGYKTIGIGCVRAGGYLFWVQEFGVSDSGESASSCTGPVTVTVDSDVLGANNIGAVYADRTGMAIDRGSTENLPQVTACLGWARTAVTVNGVAWQSGNTSVAAVSGNKIAANAAGTATLSATVLGKAVTVDVLVPGWSSSVTASGGIVDLGSLPGFDKSKASGWSSSCTLDGNLLKVSASGAVTYDYAVGDTSVPLHFDVTVSKASVKTKCDVTLQKTSVLFTGKAQKPAVTVQRTIGGKVIDLTEGTDYKLTYAENVNVGTATVTVMGIRLYNGSVTLTFTIKPVNIKSMELPYTEKPFADKAWRPAPTVYRNSTVLVKDTDYTVSYENNVNAGTATVTVTGIGNYKGTLTQTFKITKVPLTSSVLAYTEKAYTGRALKPAVTVKAKVAGKTVEIDSANYTVTYTNNMEAGTATVTVKGKGNFTGTITKTFTITPVPLTSAVLAYTEKEYTGKTMKPAVTVKAKVAGKTGVIDSANYTVTYKNCKSAGTATVTVTGTGNFTGTITKTFTITPVALKSVKLAYTQAAFTGKALKPGVTVKATVNGQTVTLTAGTDYTVTYKNNINVGTATVTVKGKGNFTGTITKTFAIVD